MRIVTISMELGFENLDDRIDFNNKESIADFLNEMLYGDVEFFGEFGPENITDIKEIDD